MSTEGAIKPSRPDKPGFDLLCEYCALLNSCKTPVLGPNKCLATISFQLFMQAFQRKLCPNEIPALFFSFSAKSSQDHNTRVECFDSDEHDEYIICTQS